ncbi:MAG: GAF domain-containing protein [Longimicrobiales bacterium]
MAISIQAPTTGTDVERYTRLVRRVLDVPVVCISLLDADGWLTTSSHGLPPPNAMLIAWSFLKRTSATGHLLVIGDGRVDPRVMRMPMVHDGTVTAYLGMKLVAPDDRVVGTLSAMDEKPRRWSARDLGFMRRVGGRIVAERGGKALAVDLTRETAAVTGAV